MDQIDCSFKTIFYFNDIKNLKIQIFVCMNIKFLTLLQEITYNTDNRILNCSI